MIGETKIDVLDHGYVRAIESWGSDERIIEAARMSTSKGFLGWGYACPCACHGNTTAACRPCLESECRGEGTRAGDEKLLRYLHENRHATPFEFGGLVIEVQAPIFVFREWHRHRTQCLAPDTLIHFTSPAGKIFKQSIFELWRKWQPTIRSARPERQINALWPRSRIEAMRIRCADEEEMEIATTSILDIVAGDPKPMVTVITAGGKTLTATRAHLVWTKAGWLTLGEAIDGGASLAAEGFARDNPMRVARQPIDEASEEWRRVVGNDLYEVSSEGRLRAAKRIVTQRAEYEIGEYINIYGANGGSGYECASLRSPDLKTTEARLVHTLVLEAFVGPRPTSCEARHLNSNAADARLSNLRWGTAKENAEDRVRADRQQRLSVRFEEIATWSEAGEIPTFDISVKGPWHNFVANGLVVHNSYNEMSARYTPLPDVNYVPTVERMLMGGGSNKQATGIGDEILGEHHAIAWLERLRELYDHAQEVYALGLSLGAPKELARLPVPVARYSRMRASSNLRNWLAFMTLRCDVRAQWEIRQYANVVADLIAERFPRTAELWREGRRPA